jgi:hypothetical protein
MEKKCPDDECVRLKERIDIQLRTIDRQSEKLADLKSLFLVVHASYQRYSGEKVELCEYIAKLEAKLLASMKEANDLRVELLVEKQR